MAIFGKNVEDAYGPLRYLVFYFAGGFAAMLAQTAMTLLFSTAAAAQVPELGASGAIAAVLGAYFLLYPSSRVRTWIFPVCFVSVPAWIFLAAAGRRSAICRRARGAVPAPRRGHYGGAGAESRAAGQAG